MDFIYFHFSVWSSFTSVRVGPLCRGFPRCLLGTFRLFHASDISLIPNPQFLFPSFSSLPPPQLLFAMSAAARSTLSRLAPALARSHRTPVSAAARLSRVGSAAPLQQRRWASGKPEENSVRIHNVSVGRSSANAFVGATCVMPFAFPKMRVDFLPWTECLFFVDDRP